MLQTWTVTLRTPHGMAELDVPTTLGPDAASRRAHMAACSLGWGDLDTITVESVVTTPTVPVPDDDMSHIESMACDR